MINFGAGFDTTYWNLKDEGCSPQNFIEVDFPGVTTKKCYFIKSKKQLLEKLSSEGNAICKTACQIEIWVVKGNTGL